MKKVNQKNVIKVLENLTQFIKTQNKESRSLFAEDLNDFLDGLSSEDYFGTEGQCDPRGDQRQ